MLECPDKSVLLLSTILSGPIAESATPTNFKSLASNLALESSPEAKSSISIPFPKLGNTLLWYFLAALSLKVIALLAPFPI